jgi:hypothetical protein
MALLEARLDASLAAVDVSFAYAAAQPKPEPYAALTCPAVQVHRFAGEQCVVLAAGLPAAVRVSGVSRLDPPPDPLRHHRLAPPPPRRRQSAPPAIRTRWGRTRAPSAAVLSPRSGQQPAGCVGSRSALRMSHMSRSRERLALTLPARSSWRFRGPWPTSGRATSSATCVQPALGVPETFAP